MLMQRGKRGEAAEILSGAQQQLAGDTQSSESQRAFRSRTITSILGDDDGAQREHRRALDLVRQQSATTASLAEQVKLLLQEARILEATGEHSAVAARSEEAKALAKAAGIKLNPSVSLRDERLPELSNIRSCPLSLPSAHVASVGVSPVTIDSVKHGWTESFTILIPSVLSSIFPTVFN
jgi:hypothetical protein